MFCHWEYDRIPVIKSTEKKPCNTCLNERLIKSWVGQGLGGGSGGVISVSQADLGLANNNTNLKSAVNHISFGYLRKIMKS
jgi:hypothetical protein